MPRLSGLIIRYVLAFVFALVLFSANPANASLKDLDSEIGALLSSVQPSVVTVYAFRDSDPLGPNYAITPSHIDTLIGSGIVYDTSGNIVTTGHVIRGSNRYEVHTWDGRKFSAIMVGIDTEFDLSVLKVIPGQLEPMPIAERRPVRAGSLMFAVGNSYGIPNSASLATAVGYRADGSLQVSANLTPGFSGGPVVNTSGKLVGMISAKLTEPVALGGLELYQSEGGTSETWSFTGASLELPSTGVILAICASDYRTAAARVIEGFHNKRGFLGIQPEDMAGEFLTKVFGLSSGVMISEVLKNSPAWKVGLRSGDILTHFLGREIQSAEELRDLIGRNRPGDIVTLKAFRDGRSLSYTVQLTSTDFYSYHLSTLEKPGTFTTASSSTPKSDLSPEEHRAELQRKLDRLMIEVRNQMKEIRRIEQELDELRNSSK